MKTRVFGLSLVVVAIVVALMPVSVGAQAPGTETSVTVTDVVAGAPLVGKHFTTDLQVSVTSGTLGVGVMGAEIWLGFDPSVVSVYDFDGDPGNGTQVEIKNGFFDGTLLVVANDVFYETPAIAHPPECETQGCIHFSVSHFGDPVTNKTGTVATMTWVAEAIGSPNITILQIDALPGSVLSDADGEIVPINSTSVPDIAVTSVGTIEGVVRRQSTRTDHAGVEVVAIAAGGGVYTASTTGEDGSFTLEVPLAGTYNVDASYPGYLHAGKNSIAVTGETVDIGTAKLVGGDVNADNCINILDVVSIIGDFGLTGLDASDPQDINDDSTVNILDLTVTAGNFSRCGPTAWVP